MADHLARATESAPGTARRSPMVRRSRPLTSLGHKDCAARSPSHPPSWLWHSCRVAMAHPHTSTSCRRRSRLSWPHPLQLTRSRRACPSCCMPGDGRKASGSASHLGSFTPISAGWQRCHQPMSPRLRITFNGQPNRPVQPGSTSASDLTEQGKSHLLKQVCTASQRAPAHGVSPDARCWLRRSAFPSRSHEL
jgi:hypothetical protein